MIIHRLLLFFLTISVLHAGEKHIAMIYDGPLARDEVLSSQVKKEIKALLSGNFALDFIELDGKWNHQEIEKCIEASFENPQVDLILTMGIQSSFHALQQKACPKPLVIGYNLTYFSDPEVEFPAQEKPCVATYESAFTVPEEIALFANLIEAKKLAFIGDASLIDDPAFPVIQRKILDEMKKRDITPVLIPITDNPSPVRETLCQTPCDGVIVLPTWRLSAKRFSELIEICHEQALPTFSVFGEAEVKAGVLMSQMTQNEVVRAARRVALNVQELLRRGNSSEISSHFRHALTPIINSQTAQKLAFTLPSHLQRSALHLLERLKDGAPLSLKAAAYQAAHCNLELLVEDFGVKSGSQDVSKSFSRLLPQVFFHLEGRKIDPDTAENFFGLEPENLIRSTFLLEQTLYDEKKVADFSVQRRIQKAREYHLESLELDIVLNTAIAYLSLLRLSADIHIAKENIALSRAHLNRAHELVDAGMARLSEVYRWESELAANQDKLVNLLAIKENLDTEFNRLLNRPLDTLVSLEEIPPLFYGNLTHNLEQTPLLKHFKRTMIKKARENSPKLMGLTEVLAAHERKLSAAKRAFYLPQFSAFGEFSNNLYQEGAGKNPPPGITNRKLHSKVGISLTYPLFTSGKRSSEKNQAYFDVQKTKALCALATEKIDEAVIQAVDNMKASYESIHLAEHAYQTAEKNLKLVTTSYAHGEVSVVDLLDAQHQMIVSKEQHAHAFYDYLIDVMKFERSLSQFTFFNPQGYDEI